MQPSSQHYMRVQAVVTQFVHGGKNHAHLKTDARLCRRNVHRTTLVYQVAKPLIERDGLLALAGKKPFNGIAAA